MRSVVGTMPYSCPEIVKHEVYTDKADVWSLGCVLYHMVSLQPPFNCSNPLMMASNIVEGQYPPPDPDGFYSPRVPATIKRLLATEPDSRPTISEVAAEAVPFLLAELDRAQVEREKVQAELAAERKLRGRQSSLELRRQEALKRLQGSDNEGITVSSKPPMLIRAGDNSSSGVGGGVGDEGLKRGGSGELNSAEAANVLSFTILFGAPARIGEDHFLISSILSRRNARF